MIFILKEEVMNGTVTVNTIVTGVEAVDFSQAISKLKIKFARREDITIKQDTEKKFSYLILGDWVMYGCMESEPLKMLQ